MFINEFLNFNASFEMSAEEIICLVILILYSKYGLMLSWTFRVFAICLAQEFWMYCTLDVLNNYVKIL